LIDKIITWRVIQDSDLLFQDFENEVIVYNSLSGETHQMDGFSASVLEQLMRNRCTEEELLRDICSLFSLENNSGDKQLISQIINNFDQIGLIEPCY
jgi:PqqD family protein of HPr-rel-A system